MKQIKINDLTLKIVDVPSMNTPKTTHVFHPINIHSEFGNHIHERISIFEGNVFVSKYIICYVNIATLIIIDFD